MATRQEINLGTISFCSNGWDIFVNKCHANLGLTVYRVAVKYENDEPIYQIWGYWKYKFNLADSLRIQNQVLGMVAVLEALGMAKWADSEWVGKVEKVSAV